MESRIEFVFIIINYLLWGTGWGFPWARSVWWRSWWDMMGYEEPENQGDRERMRERRERDMYNRVEIELQHVVHKVPNWIKMWGVISTSLPWHLVTFFISCFQFFGGVSSWSPLQKMPEDWQINFGAVCLNALCNPLEFSPVRHWMTYIGCARASKPLQLSYIRLWELHKFKHGCATTQRLKYTK